MSGRGLMLSVWIWSFAAVAGTPEGVGFLIQHQESSGAWGASTAEEPDVATAEALDALRTIGLRTGSNAQLAEFYFDISPAPADNELVLRRALLLARPDAWLQAGERTTHGAGFDAADALHRAMAVRLLRQTRGAHDASVLALARELAQQTPASGCFAFADGDASVSLTAEVAVALRPYSHDAFVVSARYASVLNCLRASQRADGSFGSVADTALAVIALQGAPGSTVDAETRGRNFLMATQSGDGSWGQSIRATALALRALHTTAPDWRVQPTETGVPVLVFRDREPYQGRPVPATFTVTNRSTSPAPISTIRVTATPENGGASVVLDDFPLDALAAGESRSVSIDVPTTSIAGRVRVDATIDPLDTVVEIDEFNNVATGVLNIRVLNDLAIDSSGIQFAAGNEGHVTIRAVVRNQGITTDRPVVVDIYNGNPQTGGAKIASRLIPTGLAMNATAVVEADWLPKQSSGPIPIHAIVDPENQLFEADEENNRAFRFYFSDSIAPVDLAVSAAGVSHSPAVPQLNSKFTLTAMVQNLGEADASRARVVVYNRNQPSVILAAHELASLPAGGTAPITFDIAMTTPGGLVYVVEVDPLNRLADTNRANNSAEHPVWPQTQPEVALELKGLNASPPSPYSPNRTEVHFSVNNLGSKRVETTVEVTDAETDAHLHSEVVVLDPYLGKSIRVAGIPTPSDRPLMIRVCVDPRRLLPDENPNDNCQEATATDRVASIVINPWEMDVSPVGAEIGKPVHLTALVRNESEHVAKMDVEWWQGSPVVGSSRKIGQTSIEIPARGSETAAFDWVREDGPIEVFASAVRGDVSLVSRTTAFAGRHLFLRELIKFDSTAIVQRAPAVRVAKLWHEAPPAIVVGYSNTPAYAMPEEVGVAVFSRTEEGKHALEWKNNVGDHLNDVVVADLDNDGEAEIVISASRIRTEPRERILKAFSPNGDLKWSRTFPALLWYCPYELSELAVGDVNGDGVADIAQRGDGIQVISGDDGRVLWQHHEDGDCRNRPVSSILDVDGDGSNEVLAFFENGATALFSSTGDIKWRTFNYTNVTGSVGAIVDLDHDGFPEALLPSWSNKWIFALDLLTGLRKVTSAQYDVWADGYFPVGAFRQDGLPYAAFSNNAYESIIQSYTPELEPLWVSSVYDRENIEVYGGITAVDLLNKGRPQLLTVSTSRAFHVLDSRDGKKLMPSPVGTPAIGGYVGNGWSNYAERGPVAADVDGDDHSEVLVHRETDCQRDYRHTNGYIFYGCNAVAIFASDSWSKQPSLWPTRSLRKGQVNDDLTVSTNYRWWTSQYTWNQQYLDEPARLLPDLTVAAIAPQAAQLTAGVPSDVHVTVRNVGGLIASNVQVSLYDGDPMQGGKKIGDATISAPLAVRGGEGTATIVWNAYPEGEHRLYAVANANHEIEESGEENNTASVDVMVHPGNALCDLSFNAQSLVTVPNAPLAGDAVTLTAEVVNHGAADCAATTVRLYEGLGTSSLRLAQAPLSALPAGAAANIVVATTVRPGSSHLQLVVDEEGVTLDSNRGNNRLFHELFVPESELPDLVVLELVASSTPAFAGETIAVTARLRNEGASSTPSTWRLTRDGVVVASGAVPPLAPGAETVVSANLMASADSFVLQLQLDETNALEEFNEENNALSTHVVVDPSQLQADVTSSRSAGGPSDVFNFQATLSNQSSSARTLSLSGSLRSMSGNEVAAVFVDPRRIISAGGSLTVSDVWTPGSNAPGTYLLDLQVREAGRVVARTSMGVVVESEASSAVLVGTNRATYRTGDDVIIKQRAFNRSRNAVMGATELRLAVKSETEELVYSATRRLAPMGPESSFESTDVLSLSPHLTNGLYRVEVQLLTLEGQVLSSEWAAFSVLTQQAALATASVSTPNPVEMGLPIPVSIQIRNGGNAALSQQSVQVVLLNADTLAIEAATSFTANVVAGGTQLHDVVLDTAGVPTTQKLVVVQLNGRTLATQLVDAVQWTDETPPRITVAGISDGEFLNRAAEPVVTVEDQSLVTTTVTLNGQPFVSGTAVSAEGAYVLHVESVDASGNSSAVTLHFTIDTTLPWLALSGIDDGAFINEPVTLAFDADDENLRDVVSTMNGIPFQSWDTVSAEGSYVWRVVATDAAGNQTAAERHFVIDSTPPDIIVSGVVPGQLSSHPVTPVVEINEGHLAWSDIRLDGVPFVSGTLVSTEGTHLLSVTAGDFAGNEASYELSFSLDLTAPTITIAGVTDGAFVRSVSSLGISANDSALASVQILLNGQAVNPNASVTVEGAYALLVRATDAAGNPTEKELAFTVDATPPHLAISGVAAGAFVNTSPQLTFTAQDPHLQTLAATLDGQPVASGIIVSSEGPHLLRVLATDRAGNEASMERAFTVDKTPPVLSVLGVADGAEGNAFAIQVAASDAHLESFTSTLDGVAFTSTRQVDAPGAHVLSVQARDRAGNVSTRTVHFTVLTDTPPPQGGPTFRYAVCALGNLKLSNNVRVDGVSNSGRGSVAAHGTVMLTNWATIAGDVVTGKGVTLTNDARIEGKVYHHEGVDVRNAAVILGGTQLLTPAPKPCDCEFDLAAAAAQARVDNNNATLRALPGASSWYTNGDLRLWNVTVTLPSGRYFVRSVSLSGNARLTIEPGAHVELFVEKGVALSNTSIVGRSSAEADGLRIYSTADATRGEAINLSNTTQAFASFYAPAATVHFANDSVLHGAVVGKDVTLANKQRLSLSPGAQAVPPALSCE